MRMPRSTRMRRREEFQRVRRRGRSRKGKFLLCAVLHDESLPFCKFGIVTPKRVGNAVNRNRIRRRVRGVIQAAGDDLLPGHYIVTIARTGAAAATFEQLRSEWIALAHGTGVLTTQQQ